jgi:hypothetical protein
MVMLPRLRLLKYGDVVVAIGPYLNNSVPWKLSAHRSALTSITEPMCGETMRRRGKDDVAGLSIHYVVSARSRSFQVPSIRILLAVASKI